MPRRDPPTDEEIQRVKELFGKSLKALRKRRSLSRIDLATDAGLNDESLGRMERGEGNPEFATLIRVAIALNMSLAQLFSSMGQTEGLGRQLTVQERDVAVSGLRFALEALTGSAIGELSERGVARSTAPFPKPFTYTKPRARKRDRSSRKRQGGADR